MTHLQRKALSGTSLHSLSDGCPVAAHLKVLTALAVKLSGLTAQVEACPTEGLASLDRELERLAAQFDEACAEAEAMGVPFGTEFNTTDEAGCCYRLALTAEGVLLRVA